jgi:hypothetical protein
MMKLDRVHAFLLTAVSVALLAPAVSVAQGTADRDAREISSYVLTEEGVAKFARVSTNLGALAEQFAANCDDDNADDDEGGDNASSLDDMVARINAVPGAQAAIQSAGMTTREYVVFSMSLFQSGVAAWALSQPGGTLPPGISKANVDFYRAHEQALKKLGADQGSDACDDSDEAEEEPEEPTE